MALATWPEDVNYRPRRSDFQPYQPFLAPIASQFEGGNSRSRARAGDNVGTITQTIEMPNTQLATFMEWLKTTLNNGTARFTANVFINGAFVSKTCKFHDKVPTPLPISGSYSAVTMTLRVFGV